MSDTGRCDHAQSHHAPSLYIVDHLSMHFFDETHLVGENIFFKLEGLQLIKNIYNAKIRLTVTKQVSFTQYCHFVSVSFQNIRNHK